MADNERELAITPEMIEAGLDAFFMYCEDSLPDETVRRVYLAMRKARLASRPVVGSEGSLCDEDDSHSGRTD
jgi:hypothetical protein